MCYFRALLKKEEISLRMYDLSGIVIKMQFYKVF